MSQGCFMTMWCIARSEWKSVGSGAGRSRTMSRLLPTKSQGKRDLSVARPAPRWLTEPGDSWKIGSRSTRTVMLALLPYERSSVRRNTSIGIETKIFGWPLEPFAHGKWLSSSSRRDRSCRKTKEVALHASYCLKIYFCCLSCKLMYFICARVIRHPCRVQATARSSYCAGKLFRLNFCDSSNRMFKHVWGLQTCFCNLFMLKLAKNHAAKWIYMSNCLYHICWKDTGFHKASCFECKLLATR